jgi:hypothetical protein
MRFLLADHLPKILRRLFFFSAAAWVAFGIAGLVRLGIWTGPRLTVMLVVSFLMFGNSIGMAWFGWMIGREPTRYLRLATLFVFLNLVLSLTDEFGLYDFISLVFYLVLFTLCLRLVLLTNRRNS